MYCLTDYAQSLIATNPAHCLVRCRGLVFDLGSITQAEMARIYQLTGGRTALVARKTPPPASPRKKAKLKSTN